MLQALGIIPPPKREALSIIDAEDEDILPSPKRQKGEHNEDLIQSMQVRDNWHVESVPLLTMGSIGTGGAGPVAAQGR